MMERQGAMYWHHFLKKRHGGEGSEAGEWPVISPIDANKRNNKGMKPEEKCSQRVRMRQSSHSAGYRNKKSEKRGRPFILNRTPTRPGESVYLYMVNGRDGAN